MTIPSASTIERINRLVPSDLVDDVVAAVDQLGGEGKRADIIDRAVAIRGWSDEELAVRSRYVGAARTYHVRTCADYAVTTCRDRGLLEAGAIRGRWRLTGALGDVSPHPHGRVFLAAIGVAGDPVGDDWRADDYAAEHGHIWFPAPSTQLSVGDHLFAIGVERGRAVLGLFEVLSAGDLREPANPWDAERWPYAVAVRPLAGVPPAEATSVDSVNTPRNNAVRVSDVEAQRGLYRAVAGRAYSRGNSAAASDNHSLAERARSTRRPRPFDPERRPTEARRGDATADPEETAVLHEKARQGHHDILARLHGALTMAGWDAVEEIPAAIDLRARALDGSGVIFEAKTISTDNETAQARAALAQLLEYRQEYGHPEDVVCVAVDVALSERRAELLERLGVGVVLVDENGVRALNEIAAELI